ncbi:GATA zinc finger domain-containing protein 14 [Contarinia nasturtii]|uniref:GATA zinc finger domain-containing protein 14 n=1 Tax=Contarinia nasturtii TaxID=265458 RepID=UPI0012D4BC1A|nr:GATA zinc finger domain-containing protein 14 [Contarinia nasturtii]
MSSIAADQVNIDVEQLNDANKHNTLRVGELAVDGRHRSGHAERSGHNRNGSNHSQNGRSRRRSRSRSRSHSPSHRNKRATETAAPPTERDVTSNSHDVEPLLVTNTNHKKQTELDNEGDSDENVAQNDNDSNNSGVDDGFFVGTRADTDNDAKHHHQNHNHNDHNVPHDNNPPFPYAPGFNPNVIFDSAGNPQVVPDINVYQQKKNLAQGMMDLALLSANANQLRYVVETYKVHPYYWFSLISISISLILQVAVGVGLILNSRYNVKNKEQICRADKINNFTIIGIFLITTVNVFITAFGVAPAPT